MVTNIQSHDRVLQVDLMSLALRKHLVELFETVECSDDVAADEVSDQVP